MLFDRCRFWRRKLSQHADGALPPAQWGALEDHLAGCAACRAASSADSALREVLCRHDGLTDAGQRRRFDDRVLHRVQTTAKPARRSPFPFLAFLLPESKPLQGSQFGFATQVMGGALVAGMLTAICLLPALSFHAPGTAHSRAARGHLAAPRNEPPIPLEALLETPSPRAALLWGAPNRARFHRSAPASRPSAPRPAPETPVLREGTQHSRLRSGNVLG